jgi:hypothetical protein
MVAAAGQMILSMIVYGIAQLESLSGLVISPLLLSEYQH